MARYAYLFLSILTLILAACSPSGGRQLHERARQAAFAPTRDKGDSLATLILEDGVRTRDEQAEAWGLYLRSSYRTDDNPDTMARRLARAEQLALSAGSDSLLSLIHNLRGCLSLARDGDFPAARISFIRSARYARNAGAADLEMIAQCNLSDTYSMTGDTLGIAMDRQVYDYALAHRDTATAAASAYHCAAYYLGSPLRPAAPGAARPYIDALRALGDTSRYYQLMGLYYLGADSLTQAESILHRRVTQYPGNANAHLYYAWLLWRANRPQASLTHLTLADSINRHNGRLTRPEADWLRFKNYQLSGQTQKAISALEQYAGRTDSLATARTGEDAARMRVVYDIDAKNAELAMQRQTLRFRTGLFIGIIVLIALTFLIYLLWRRRRRSLYRAIVTLASPEPTSDKPDKSDTSLQPDKTERIWQAINREIDENRIYADPCTTRDTFAERVGVNHTYFSQIIKQRTGKTYLQFINSCRIREALRILAERAQLPDVRHGSMSALARELGFMSTATFYKAFRAQVGITPAAYLDTLRTMPTTTRSVAAN